MEQSKDKKKERVFETVEYAAKHRDRIEVAKELADEIDAGRSPIEYLKNLGYKNPRQAFMDIKKHARKKVPELGARFPHKVVTPKAETPEEKFVASVMEEMNEEPVTVKLDGPIRIETYNSDQVSVVETPEKPAVPKITKPLMYDGFTVRSVEGQYGTYKYKEKYGYFDFDSADSVTTVSMTLEELRGFLKELKEAAAILGVEL